MSGIEGLEANPLVEQRSAELAERFAELPALKVWTMLDEHSVANGGTMEGSQIETVVEAERAKAKEQFLSERAAGKKNDSRSFITSGLQAVLTKSGKSMVETQTSTDEPTLTSPQFEPCGTDSQGEELYAMRLPNGVFIEGDGSITMNFYQDAQVRDGLIYGIVGQEGRIGVGLYGVVRIEGDGGEFWQNEAYAEPIELSLNS